MNTVTNLEQQILALPPTERERLATLAWESLAVDGEASGDCDIDQEGVNLATRRDEEIDSGAIQPIDHTEFLRRTGDESP